MLKMLDLFSGIGGFSLGCEATKGFQTIAFCEIDPFCQKVLKKHWPDVPIFDDITKLGEGELNGLGDIDVICGGFPCQDISCAGKGAGIHAARSGLWWEMLRIVRLVRPRYVLVENVAALLNRGLDEVLGSLAESGYDAEWQMLRASDFGLPHRRERIFLIAYSGGLRFDPRWSEQSLSGNRTDGKEGLITYPDRGNGNRWAESGNRGPNRIRIFSQDRKTSNTMQPGLSQSEQKREFRRSTTECDWGQAPSPVCGMDDVVPNRVDRLRALGNAIVPQCATHVAECVLEYDAKTK